MHGDSGTSTVATIATSSRSMYMCTMLFYTKDTRTVIISLAVDKSHTSLCLHLHLGKDLELLIFDDTSSP